MRSRMLLSSSALLALTGVLIAVTALFTGLSSAAVRSVGANGVATVSNKDSSPRTIEFAGRQWIVKSGCDRGPGPNCWSDSSESVWVEDGTLHLKIRRIGDEWHSTEVYTRQCTQYGVHRFFVRGRIDNLDKNIVFAPFLYNDDRNEIDIEFARWGVENPTDNAQYVVQPAAIPGNRESFPLALNGLNSTHSIEWNATMIRFKSLHGHHVQPPTDAHLIRDWEYSGGDSPPETKGLRVHINFWLHQGNPPSNSEEAEIIVENVQLPAAVDCPRVHLPAVIKQHTPTPTPTVTATSTPPVAPTPTPTPTTTPWVSITASNDRATGEVGPPAYCNGNYKIALYAKTDIWYVQPQVSEPARNVRIRSDCTWRSDIGGWNQVAAHLVPTGFVHPDQVANTSRCPPPPLNPATNSDILAVNCTP